MSNYHIFLILIYNLLVWWFQWKKYAHNILRPEYSFDRQMMHRPDRPEYSNDTLDAGVAA